MHKNAKHPDNGEKRTGSLCQSKQNPYLCTRYYELVALIQIIH
ncbi:hypothetical protein M124_2301 [Bacteroides fragilis str. 3988T(B)14]|uniref:Uncharacterized protein n=1 Tax=Bacteroides fragilis str. 3988T(B)14 TaxID=1339315 RepID=A0A015SNY1_BACFG|nr:hypothetical protein M077_3080 [Bacteroides fragilis str. 2-F-2 \